MAAASVSELRVVLLGNSWSDRSSVGNFILRKTEFNTEEEPDCCQSVRGQLKEKEMVVINTPDLLHPNISADKLRKHVEMCKRVSAPGPHVFLLVLQPEDFTEEHKLRLYRVLQLFSDQSFDRSLILISPAREDSSGFMENYVNHPPLKDLIRTCRYRHLKQKELELSELLTRLGQTAQENNGEHLSCDGCEDEDAGLTMTLKSELTKAALNLVLCGRRGAEKTSAAKALLGQTELHSVSNSSECVKHQGEVCGRQVSLVELPALYGKPQEAVMEESFRCISLCGPEGVHAFVLVLPVDALTDEDKGELKTIQDTFSSRVNDFTMILFTVDSDPTAPVVGDFVRRNRDIQELVQSCGGRSVVLNTENKQQVSEILDMVEKMRVEASGSFTKDMFTRAQMQKLTRLKAELKEREERKKEHEEEERKRKKQEETQQQELRSYTTEMFDNMEEFKQTEVKKIWKQKEEDMKRKEEEVRRKHEEEMKTLQRKISEQSGEIEKEKKLRAKQLKEKDDCINKEREERKKEREEEERKRKKQEETQRQEWRRKLEASEKRIKSEREERENAERKLELCRKEMKRDREAWDKEKNNIWEQRYQDVKQNLEEEKTSHRNLQDLYNRTV
ncbi:hypothetical protein PAMP_021736 [Pampus punctatissimus]